MKWLKAILIAATVFGATSVTSVFAASGPVVGDAPYIYVTTYCDPYIYCSVSNGTRIDSLPPLVQQGPETWTTQEALDAQKGKAPVVGTGSSPVQVVTKVTSFCAVFGGCKTPSVAPSPVWLTPVIGVAVTPVWHPSARLLRLLRLLGLE